jgi:hypothetical protein
MDRMSLVRGGGLAGLLGVGLTLAAVIVGAVAGHDPQQWARLEVDTILLSMHQNPELWVLSMWGFLIANTLLVGFALGVHQLLPGRQGMLGIAPWAIALGVVFLNVLTLVAIGMTLGLAGPYGTASEAEIPPLEALALTLGHFENHARALAYVLLSTGTLMIGLRVLRSSPSALPRWTGWMGMVGGAAGIAGAFRLAGEFLFLLSVAGPFVTMFGLILPASIVLLRLRQIPEETRKDALTR